MKSTVRNFRLSVPPVKVSKLQHVKGSTRASLDAPVKTSQPKPKMYKPKPFLNY